MSISENNDRNPLMSGIFRNNSDEGFECQICFELAKGQTRVRKGNKGTLLYRNLCNQYIIEVSYVIIQSINS